MKISKKRSIVILSAALIISVITAAFAVSAYDGTTDPIISLSYLRQYKSTEIDPQIVALQNEITMLKAQITSLSGSQNTQAPTTPVVNTGGYTVIQVEHGRKIMAGASCEIILRSGTATVILDPYSGGGISDLTEGKDLKHGEDITLNHLLLVPRNDGRGIHITSDGAFLMIKGDYTVE